MSEGHTSAVRILASVPEKTNMTTNIKTKLIAAGVKNLKAFGYPKCDKKNILTDSLYKAFFASLLKDNKGNGSDIDQAIDELLTVCEGDKT